MMDIRSSLDGLKSLLGVNPADSPNVSKPNAVSQPLADSSSDRATLSSASSQVANMTADSSVRADKVASIQAALASGTYNIPAPVVASRVVDSMLDTTP